MREHIFDLYHSLPTVFDDESFIRLFIGNIVKALEPQIIAFVWCDGAAGRFFLRAMRPLEISGIQEIREKIVDQIQSRIGMRKNDEIIWRDDIIEMHPPLYDNNSFIIFSHLPPPFMDCVKVSDTTKIGYLIAGEKPISTQEGFQKYNEAINDVLVSYGRHVSIEQKLNATRVEWDRMRFILGRLNEGIIILDPNEKIYFANAIARKLFGKKPHERIPQEHLLDIYDLIRKQTGHDAAAELITTSIDEQALVNTSAIQDSFGRKVGTIVFLRDVTSLNLYVGRSLHDIKNVFEAAKQKVDLVSSDSTFEDAIHALDRISKISEIAVAYSEDLAGFFRAASGKFSDREKENCNLNILTKDVVDLIGAMAELWDIPIEYSPFSQEVLVNVFPEQIKCIIRNLMFNSITSTSKLKKKKKRKYPVSLEIEKDGGEAILRVTDKGEGMSQKMLEEINALQIFLGERKYEVGGNIGVGLMVSFKYINNHQGTLKFESAPGVGTTAIIRIPCNP